MVAKGMNNTDRENWLRVLEALMAAGKGDCEYAKRARAILAGKPDPLK